MQEPDGMEVDNHQEGIGSSEQRVELRILIGRSTVHTLFSIDFNSYYPLAITETGEDNGE